MVKANVGSVVRYLSQKKKSSCDLSKVILVDPSSVSGNETLELRLPTVSIWS